MRVTAVLAWTLVGVILAGCVQWVQDGAPVLAARLPGWALPLLPVAAFLIFGAFLVTAYGGSPGMGQGILGAVAALLVAGLPLTYAYGLAQRHGLPVNAGPIGALLAGSYARGAATLWLPTAIAAALRKPRVAIARPGRPTAGEAVFTQADAPPFWTPATATSPGADASQVAYTPGEGERA